eukprot:Platyproteum_vivax@DN899_c0_g1_i1.p1
MRRSKEADWFMPYEDILGTVLHELTHIVHGPHKGPFYALLDEITRECEDLMAKGIVRTGQGFDLPGARLGGTTASTDAERKTKTLEAMEKRIHLDRLGLNSSNRLGGDRSVMKALSPGEAAARAAERRAKDDLQCGGNCETAEEAEIQENDTSHSLPVSHSNPNIAGKSGTSNNVTVEKTVTQTVTSSNINQAGDSSRRCASHTVDRRIVIDLLDDDMETGDGETGETGDGITKPFQTWTCLVCTLINRGEECVACGTKKQRAVDFIEVD